MRHWEFGDSRGKLLCSTMRLMQCRARSWMFLSVLEKRRRLFNFLLFSMKETHSCSLLGLKAHHRCGSKSVCHSFQACFGTGWVRKEKKMNKAVLNLHLIFYSFLIICIFAALIGISTAVASKHPRQMLSYKPNYCICVLFCFWFFLTVQNVDWKLAELLGFTGWWHKVQLEPGTGHVPWGWLWGQCY